MVVKELLIEDRDIENAIKKITEAQKYVETMNSWYDGVKIDFGHESVEMI